MQKIKTAIIHKMIAAKCTSAEVNMILHLSHYQSDEGVVVGVAYKEIMSALHISDQTYYDVIRHLQDKRIIEVNREYYGDLDIRIIDNDFSDGDYSQGYLKTSYQLFSRPAFLKLKANEKLLAMLIVIRDTAAVEKNRSVKIGVQKFYSDYGIMFGVSKRILQRYLTSLRCHFSIGIVDGVYRFRTKVNEIANAKTTDKQMHALWLAKCACRRARVKLQGNVIEDLIRVIELYYNRLKSSVSNFIMKAINDSIAKATANRYIRNPYKWNRKLEPSFVHSILKEEMAAAGI